MKLDLGCGHAAQDGYEGVDRRALPGVKHVLDLESTPWICTLHPLRGGVRPISPVHHSFADDSVEAIFCSHLVEHVLDLCAFMNECYRVLEPGGHMVIRHPYQFSLTAWQDPTHVRALNEITWNYFDASWREQMGLDHYPITADFSYLEALPAPSVAFRDNTPEAFERARHRFIGVVDELQVTLRKRDPDSPLEEVATLDDIPARP